MITHITDTKWLLLLLHIMTINVKIAASASVAMLLQVVVLDFCYEYVLFVSRLLIISYTDDLVQLV